MQKILLFTIGFLFLGASCNTEVNTVEVDIPEQEPVVQEQTVEEPGPEEKQEEPKKRKKKKADEPVEEEPEAQEQEVEESVEVAVATTEVSEPVEAEAQEAEPTPIVEEQSAPQEPEEVEEEKEQEAEPAKKNTKKKNSSTQKGAAPQEEQKITVTLSVAGPGAGNYSVQVDQGATVETVMNTARAQGFSYSTKAYSGLGVYVEAVNGVKEDGGMYWIYSVNGAKAATGISNYAIKNGDTILWTYEKQY